jgi:hypothetical protein
MNIDALKQSIRYITNPQGEQTDVLVPLSLWDSILCALGQDDAMDSKAELLADLRQSLLEAQSGQTLPIEALWDELEDS